MKYYFATSSLNLDNILQSECILPIGHYNQRISGYKIFEQVEEMRPINSIVFFKYPVEFFINDPNRYNFPMLIELEDDNQTSDLCECPNMEGVVFCTHAINLTPTNCKIYFYTEQAYNLTTINTRSNKSIKYYNEYNIYPTTRMLKLSPMPTIKVTDSNEIGICEDVFIDKQKGGLYGYLLGTSVSVNHDIAVQMRVAQELYNVLTSLIATPSSIVYYRENLITLLEIYRKIDKTEKENARKFEENLNISLGKRFSFLKECFVEFLKSLDCWDILFDALTKKWGCHLLPQIERLKTENEYRMLRSEIEKRTSTSLSEYRKTCQNPTLENIDIKEDYIEIGDASLINEAIKYIIKYKKTQNILLSNRLDIYMDIMGKVVPLLKEKIKEENWKGSKEQHYINTLYAFINDQETPFNINDIDNLELKSIAAFIIKGHSFNDCMTYLKMSEFENYSYVLTLWGCLCGYMEMSQSSLKPILSIQTYSDIYKLLYRKDMGKITEDSTKTKITDNPVENKRTEAFVIEEYSFILDVFKYKDKDELLNILEERIQTSNKDIHDILNDILNEKQFKRAKKQCENARYALTIYLCAGDREKLLKALTDFKVTKIGSNSILEHYKYNVPKTSKKKKKTDESSSQCSNDLFTLQENNDTGLQVKIEAKRDSRKSLLDDQIWIEKCASFIKDSRAQKQFIEDMSWFVDNHKQKYINSKGTPNRGYYADSDKSNTRTLERLQRYLENRRMPKSESTRWLSEVYTNIPIEQIINLMKQLYGE